jgi:threonine/homoserine efflux transporter RhtA
LEAVGTIAATVVGLAFIAAGVFKLVDGPAWPKQAADMGVGRPLAMTVPYVEIVIGAVLALQLFEPWPAVAATALLVAFTGVIVLRLLDGSRPPCACFGSRSKRPLGTYHVVRNLGLLALAVVAAIWA